MEERTRELIQGLKTISGATEASLKDLISKLGYSLPEEYMEFMRFSNGAEGHIGEGKYLVLWPVEEIIALNEGYALKDDAPGLLLFGSNSGSTGYAFNTKSPGMPIVEVDLILTDLIEPIATTFLGFLERLATE